MMSFLHIYTHTHSYSHTHTLSHVCAAVDFGQISGNTSCFSAADETCATNLQRLQPKDTKHLQHSDSPLKAFNRTQPSGSSHQAAASRQQAASSRQQEAGRSSQGPSPNGSVACDKLICNSGTGSDRSSSRPSVCRLSKVYLFDTEKS